MFYFDFRRTNPGQIPFEIYESAYSEEPEEERETKRKIRQILEETTSSLVFSCANRRNDNFSLNFSGKNEFRSITKISFRFSGSNIDGSDENNFADFHSRTSIVSRDVGRFSRASRSICQVRKRENKLTLLSMDFVSTMNSPTEETEELTIVLFSVVEQKNMSRCFSSVWRIVRMHVIVSSKLQSGIYPLFMPAEKVPCRRNLTTRFSAKHFNAITILVQIRAQQFVEREKSMNFGDFRSNKNLDEIF